MECRLVFKSWKLHFSLEKVSLVTGVNSKLDDGKHILMWDFDEVQYGNVLASLRIVQNNYKLPQIHIISTGRKDCYHAYCFKKCSFQLARTIIASTEFVDLKYLAIGLLRSYFTLRISDAGGRKFLGLGVIPSEVLPDCMPEDISSMVEYTKPLRGHVNAQA